MRAWFGAQVAAGIMAFAASSAAMAASAVEDANAAVQAARQGNYEEAIELFTNAINSDELTLKSRAQAYAYRGIAKAAIGDYDSAGLDLNSAVVLDSDYNADALAVRGFFHLARGDNQEGWNGERFGAYYDWQTWQTLVTGAGFSEIEYGV